MRGKLALAVFACTFATEEWKLLKWMGEIVSEDKMFKMLNSLNYNMLQKRKPFPAK